MARGVSDDSTKPGQPTEQSDDTATAANKTAMTDSSKTSSETKSSRRKPVPTRKNAAKDPDATVLQADIDKLEARLKRANKATRKSVQSLETVVAALEASLKTSNDSQTSALTRHVNNLTRRLEKQEADMRSSVREELRAALASGDMDGLGRAIGRASTQLENAEIVQSEAIAKVNRHLADIARAVDQRMKQESRARREELDAVAKRLAGALQTSIADMDDRVSTVEKDSAEALTKVGSTIEQIHKRLEERHQTSNETVVEKLNELAHQTQAEFKMYRAEIDTRFQEVEARHLAVGTGAAERVIERVGKDIDHKIESLQKRVKEVESRSTNSGTPRRDQPNSPIAFPPLPNLDDKATDTNSSANPIQTLKDRLGQGSTNDAPSHPRRPYAAPQRGNPYAAALNTVDTEEPLTLGSPLPQVLNNPASNAAPPSVLPFPASPQNDPQAGAALPPFQMPSAMPPLPPVDDFLPAPLPDAVFANPAYAENSATDVNSPQSPKAMRVAETPKRSFKLPDIPFSNRNLRVALLATGVALVAIMAGRAILGGGGPVEPGPVAGGGSAVTINNPPPTTVPNSTPFFTPGQTGSAVTPETGPNAPIGDYTENRPVEIDPASLDTLDAALEAGNPIAQFQLGLTKLDAGETDEGAALIRQAASANQPAALYRLAKLYEAGEGVPRDDVMARQLIERAARGGNRIAMHDLALYYTEGRGGVDLNMATAKSWFEQAARRGVVDSQFNLAVLSENTEIGLDPDPEEALFWYAIAAQQGDQFAISRRDALRASLDSETLSRLDARVEAFRPRPIEEEANGIFNNVPWISNGDSASAEQVRQAQTLLASLGYEVGTPDGLMGSRTRTAITSFERANGLSETGEVSGQLLSRLSQAANS